jgi:Uri superfamily endonuclease
MDKGIYCLVFRNPSCTLEIGSLGSVHFRDGWHVYVGSALGPGGLKRAVRHIRLFREKDRPPRWHVDRLLLSGEFSLEAVVCAPADRPAECAVAGAFGWQCVPGFGSSDCRCPSHLFFCTRPPVAAILHTMDRLHLHGTSTTIK